MRLLLAISILALVGCYERPDYATTQPDYDEVWSSYHFKGPMPRAYVKNAFGMWVSTGREVTTADIDAAPCRVVIGDYQSSHYTFSENTIYLDAHAKISVLWHESQHCVDLHNGITDVRELELRAMIIEMGGVIK